MKEWKIAGINFDHMHMGDLLRRVHEHPHARIVGICDLEPARMQEAIATFSIDAARVFTDVDACLERTQPDVVILCPATGDHAAYVEKVARHRVHVLLEKPFAGSLAEADRIIATMKAAGREIVINWPLRWYATHATSKRLIDEGRIGRVLEVHYYDGNRGPLRHGADKVEKSGADRSASWFYRRDKAGGSLRDYLGYGVTLATWFLDGKAPIEITCTVDEPAGLEVDEHSITVARYDTGLSKFETKWGTFTDPWTHQPQPKCGFVIVGTAGTIASYDYESHVRVQTEGCPAGEAVPVDVLRAPYDGPINYFLHCLETGEPVTGPLSPAVSRIGQQIVDTAIRSAAEKRTITLLN